MSATQITGNLLDFPNDINTIAHSCNAQGVMGAGIALQIKDRYPEAFRVYHEAFETKDLRLGTFTVAELEENRRIVNLVTQQFYGRDERQVDYEAFYNSLEALKHVLESVHVEGRIYKLGLPHMISCQNAGGDWRVIEAMIRALFEDSPIETFIVKLS